jgi:hypothetical protein
MFPIDGANIYAIITPTSLVPACCHSFDTASQQRFGLFSLEEETMRKIAMPSPAVTGSMAAAITASLIALGGASPAVAQEKKPNIVMLMTDDTGWNDFGAYSGGGAGLGHPTPNVDQIAKEGATFTNWYVRRVVRQVAPHS